MIVSVLFAAMVATGPGLPPLETVPRVDLERYLGTWYEIATIPQGFQKGCTAVTATYSLRPDGKIKVVNACRRDSLSGKPRSVTGKAWVVEKKSNGKLKVQFFWPFSGDYWIIELDSIDYSYAVVGHPNRKYLWILCRESRMEEALYNELLGRIAGHGYDLSLIKRTPQPGP